MSDIKIILDTNVIVAASIIKNIPELNTQIKHEFYDQSIQLFSMLKKNKNMGLVTPTVKDEVFHVLNKAVRSTFVPRNLKNPQRRKIFYDDATAIISAADQKRRILMTYLTAEKLDKKSVKKHLQDVKNMSKYIINEWNTKYGDYAWKNNELIIRSKPILSEEHWRNEQKQEVVNAHKRQINKEAIQLYRFQRKSNWQDEQILAESIAIKIKYEKSGLKYIFMIASCDSGFFSPYVKNGEMSNLVTREIFKRFEILCDYPRAVFFKAGGT